MATNADIVKLLEGIANGEGIQGIRSDIKILKEKVDNLSRDVKEIKDEGFHDDESLRSRLGVLERSVQNIKEYELSFIKDELQKIREKFDQKVRYRNTLATKVIGAVLVAVALYLLAQGFGITATG